MPVWPTCFEYGTQPGVDDRTRRARRTAEQLGELLDERVVRLGAAEPATAGHDDGRLFELRALALLDVTLEHLGLTGAPGVGRGHRDHRRRTAATRLGRERLRADRGQERGLALELGVDERVATEDRRADDHLVAVDAQATCRW